MDQKNIIYKQKTKKIKFIQSYKIANNENNPKLNFYPFLLSYLTLKKYYNFDVVMYCDAESYDFIKYIPYDQIIIQPKEIDYKLNILTNVDEELFIYVNPNISISDKIFDNFISNKFDILVKSVSQKISLGPYFFVNNNKELLTANNIFKTYSEKYFDTNIIGMNYEFKLKYTENMNIMKSIIKNINGSYKYGYMDLIFDEWLTYLTYLNNNFTCDKIISKDTDLIDFSTNIIYSKYKFTENSNIDHIKNEIKMNFNEHFKLVEMYEKNKLN